MKRNKKAILASVLTVLVLAGTLAGIPTLAQTNGIFTIFFYSLERHEDFFGELDEFSFCAAIGLANAEDLDSITVTDPNGGVILNTNEPELGDSDSALFCANFGTTPPPIGSYIITVTNIDGTSQSETVLTTESSLSSSTPVIISPVEGTIITDPTPILSWEPFESPEKGPDETLSYLIEIDSSNIILEDDDAVWRVGVPGDVSSITYNFDGSALPGFEELPPEEYRFILFAFEDKGTHRRTSLRFSHFIIANTVEIDIKPGSDLNSINPKSKGTIPVAILSTPSFDATIEVDKASLTFGRTGDENSLAKCTKGNEDVNDDGLDDAVCHFNTQDTGFQQGDTEGILRGKTVGGVSIEGRDSVRIVKE